MRILVSTLLALFATTPASADGFQRVADENRFVSIVEGRDLKRLGVALKVTDDGRILGSAFGRQVTGEWRWDNGYFCRDLYFGNSALGANCQMVQVNGRTVRFVSDRGQGEYADLKLD